ncbi:Cadherin-16 [Galemys pyrenaicus]|uniref:Cadherin-16 n=1 Tax=Galemys pyrenaicus TaxID=202257 RepID=A0A8J6AJ03_GALPY|nr:Cadherin-16 [Galemys pyrenaicus]
MVLSQILTTRSLRPVLTMVLAWWWLLCLSIPQLPLPHEKAEGRIVLAGNSDVASEGPFAVDTESGFLLVTRALDREEQAQYQLQVTLETEDGRVSWGPQPVRVHVKDENDQVPHFSQALYRVQLSQGTRPGVPFLFLEASDEDEPGTANSDLRFHILNQAPAQPSPDMFQLEPRLGALALSPEGSTSLHQALQGPYQLLVQAKDMGDQVSGYQTTAIVDISVAESTWTALDPVHLAENLKVLYPHNIAQVLWSGGNVCYHLETQPPGPFDVDAEGRLYVTGELDREAQAEYLLQVRAQNPRGEDYTEPLELRVVVMDENDNAPVCPPSGPPVGIPELSPPGTKVTSVSAEDADAPGSLNSHVVYRLLSPEPEEGAEEPAFQLDSTSGHVTLGAAPLQAGQHFLLQVLASDLGGAEGGEYPDGLSSTCAVTVTVLDINDHAPEFTTSQVEPICLPEDAEPGTLVATLTAADADLEPAFRLMDFAMEAGNAEGIFGLDRKPDSNEVQLRLLKKLSYEAAPNHELVVVVLSAAEPPGPGPGPGATATVTVLVERVVPGPQLDQQSYAASIPVSTPAGSPLLTIRSLDPQNTSLRFSLVNDSKGWLSIEEVSGKVLTARALQGAQPGDRYTVLVEARKEDKPALSTSATLVIHFMKGPSASALTPTLVPTPHLCTPRQDHGVVVSGPSKDPDPAGGHGPYSFALGPNPTVQRDWRLWALNGSHAYLTLALHWVEPREHIIPVVVSHEAQLWQLQVRVIVCRCNVGGQCLRKVGRMKGMPTKLAAVGTLVGTLAVIGFLLILIFAHLSLARKKDLDQPVDSMPLKAGV